MINAITEAITTVLNWIKTIFEGLSEHLNISEWSALGIGIATIILLSSFFLEKEKITARKGGFVLSVIVSAYVRALHHGNALRGTAFHGLPRFLQLHS